MRKRSSSTPANSRLDNRVRIIGGRWRGRKLQFPDGDGLRPTGDRIRETVFNWLMPVLPGAHCLDLFAGSGALGFEALSRGAENCVMLERNLSAFRHLLASKQLLAADGAMPVSGDCMQWLTTAQGAFDIVFIDPPFADETLSPGNITCLLQERHLLADNAYIYVEQQTGRETILPAGFALHRQQRAGQVSFSLWRRLENNL